MNQIQIKVITKTIYRIFEEMTSVVPDEPYLGLKYRIKLGKTLHLDHPQTLTEKLQWLKLYDRKPVYTRMVDKYEMKSLVEERLGAGYTIPALGVWDSVDEIDLDKLPDQFVLKCNHNSGSNVVCRDKRTFPFDTAKKFLTISQKRSPYWPSREWPYKDVRPRILAEPFVATLGNDDSVEYKMTCFNGRLAFGTICIGPAHVKLNQRSNDFYDKDFNFIPVQTFNRNSKHPITDKPAIWDELVRISEILSGGVPYLRVDFYVIDEQPIVGELTFFTWGGFFKLDPDEWDLRFGEMLELPSIQGK